MIAAIISMFGVILKENGTVPNTHSTGPQDGDDLRAGPVHNDQRPLWAGTRSILRGLSVADRI
jgi:hypothetical protein